MTSKKLIRDRLDGPYSWLDLTSSFITVLGHSMGNPML